MRPTNYEFGEMRTQERYEFIQQLIGSDPKVIELLVPLVLGPSGSAYDMILTLLRARLESEYSPGRLTNQAWDALATEPAIQGACEDIRSMTLEWDQEIEEEIAEFSAHVDELLAQLVESVELRTQELVETSHFTIDDHAAEWTWAAKDLGWHVEDTCFGELIGVWDPNQEVSVIDFYF